MNIKYIVNVRIPTPRAQGYAIMKMCEQFSKAGAKVDLIIPDRENNEGEDPFIYYRIEKIFNIYKIKCLDLLGKTWKFGRLFYWLDLISFFVSLKLKNIIKREDTVYTRDFTVALLFSQNTNPVYLELHDIPKSKFLFCKALKKVKKFFVLNENIKKELIDLGVDVSIVHIFPSGVELKEFDIDLDKNKARKEVELPIDRKIIIYTGHLYKWKGIDTVAETAIKMPDTLFIFLGGVDPEFSEYKNKYRNHQNIIFLPFVQRSIIPVYLKASDALVVPYTNEEEISAKYTSPLKLFEYMASKRPIISSDLSSIRQILDENTCVFAETGNPNSFKMAFERVLSDENLSEIISTNAYNKVKKYSWDQRAKKILSEISKNI